jgi:hypothetical protein
MENGFIEDLLKRLVEKNPNHGAFGTKFLQILHAKVMFEFGLQLTNFKQYHSNESEFFDLICFTLNLWKKELIGDHVADTILLSIIGEIHLFSQVFYRFGVQIHRTIPEKAEIYVRNLKRIKSECKNPQQIKSID